MQFITFKNELAKPFASEIHPAPPKKNVKSIYHYNLTIIFILDIYNQSFFL